MPRTSPRPGEGDAAHRARRRRACGPERWGKLDRAGRGPRGGASVTRCSRRSGRAASRSPSPIRLTAKQEQRSARSAGKRNSHGRVVADRRAGRRSACRGRRRAAGRRSRSRTARSRQLIAATTPSVASMISSDATFGQDVAQDDRAGADPHEARGLDELAVAQRRVCDRDHLGHDHPAEQPRCKTISARNDRLRNSGLSSTRMKNAGSTSSRSINQRSTASVSPPM